MNRLSFLAIITSMALACSCSKKPITGHVFITNKIGLNIVASGAQIGIFKRADADYFLSKKEAEIERECDSINAQLIPAKREMNAAVQKYEQSQKAFDDYQKNQEYRNNAEYSALESRVNQIQAIYRNGQRTSQVPIGNMNSEVDLESLTIMRANLSRLEYSLESPLRAKAYDANTQSQKAALKYQSILSQLQNFEVPQVYFEGFAPEAIKTDVTDSEGNFDMTTTRKNLKIVAFAQINTGISMETYFWFVDVPKDGKNIVLNNTNSFTIPEFAYPKS